MDNYEIVHRSLGDCKGGQMLELRGYYYIYDYIWMAVLYQCSRISSTLEINTFRGLDPMPHNLTPGQTHSTVNLHYVCSQTLMAITRPTFFIFTVPYSTRSNILSSTDSCDRNPIPKPVPILKFLASYHFSEIRYICNMSSRNLATVEDQGYRSKPHLLTGSILGFSSSFHFTR